MRRLLLLAIALVAAALATGPAALAPAQPPPPGDLPRGAEPVTLDPANFTTTIDNPYFPLRPGSRWVYRETDGEGGRQTVRITVTDQTRVVAGVTARVVRDVVTANGKLVEVTADWYAQDRAGNVWYLGEATQEYEDGRPATRRGSWEAGVDGAQAGIIMPARPRDGMRYRQEYREGEAEDASEVLSVDEQAEVPYRYFRRTVMTKDFTPLQPRVLEHKFYARGVGLVLVLDVAGGTGREELLRYTRGAS
jgi:hypothetical protein